MADMSDYLGHILCELTRARVKADIEALRIAREYVASKDQLLRFLSVPRMRLPTVEITMPVVIKEIPEGYVERTSTDLNLLARAISRELGPVLKERGLRIETSKIIKIIKEDLDLSKGRLPEGLIDSLSNKLHDNIQPSAKAGKTASGSENRSSAAKTFEVVAGLIKEEVRKAISALPRQPVGIAVEPRTAVIREIANPQLLFNAKLVITEDALEIHLEEEAVEGQSEEAKGIRPSTESREEVVKTRSIKRLVPE